MDSTRPKRVPIKSHRPDWREEVYSAFLSSPRQTMTALGLIVSKELKRIEFNCSRRSGHVGYLRMTCIRDPIPPRDYTTLPVKYLFVLIERTSSTGPGSFLFMVLMQTMSTVQERWLLVVPMWRISTTRPGEIASYGARVEDLCRPGKISAHGAHLECYRRGDVAACSNHVVELYHLEVCFCKG